MATGQFSQRLFELAVAIPPGRVTTYGHLAKAAGGGTQAARSVTSILSQHPNRAAIPFHRIVYAGGRVWLTDEYTSQRLAWYKQEGIVVNARGYIIDFEEILWDPRDLS
jgi:methylated-DNA-protein-cysteine methyltransferase-like protein